MDVCAVGRAFSGSSHWGATAVSSQQDQAPGSGQAAGNEQAAGTGPATTGQAAGNGQAAGTGPPAAGGRITSAWRATADGGKVFRMTPPLGLWWAWVVVAVIGLGDLAVQGHDRGAVEPALAILVITALMYACAFRPRVLTDSGGITVQNPLRDYTAPWGAVRGIFLGDSVEVQCARPAPKGDKTIYSWALYGSRRARSRTGLRTRGRDHGARGRPQGYARMPSEAQEALKQTPAEAMARELGRLSEQARARGAADGVLSAKWAWPPLTAIGVSVAALVLAILLM
jgi:Bacterial PH domain